MNATEDHDFEAFRVETRPARDLVVVVPIGELDLATIPLVEREVAGLRERGFTRIQVDLRELSFIDSSGVRLLLETHKHLEGDGGELTVVDGTGVGRALEIMGVHRILRFTDPA